MHDSMEHEHDLAQFTETYQPFPSTAMIVR